MGSSKKLKKSTIQEKNQYTRRALSIMLALLLALSLTPATALSAFADEANLTELADQGLSLNTAGLLGSISNSPISEETQESSITTLAVPNISSMITTDVGIGEVFISFDLDSDATVYFALKDAIEPQPDENEIKSNMGGTPFEAGAGLTWSLHILTPGRDYSLYMLASNGNGDSNIEQVTFTTLTGVLDLYPQGVNKVTPKEAFIELELTTWGFVKALFLEPSAPAPDLTTLMDNGIHFGVYTVGSNTLHVIELEPGTTYTVYLVAFQGWGTSQVKSITFSTPAAVCQIGTTEYVTLQDALDAAVDGDTITLLQSISINNRVGIPIGLQVTFDLAGYTLTIENTGSGPGCEALVLGTDSSLTVVGGTLNATSQTWYGILLLSGSILDLGSNGVVNASGSTGVLLGGLRATVTTATGINAAAASGSDAVLTVTDSITAIGSDGTGAIANSGQVIVNGNISAGYLGARAGEGGQVIVNGDIYVESSRPKGVHADGGGTVIVNGNINVTGTNAIGAHATNSGQVAVNGAVVTSGIGAIGINAESGDSFGGNTFYSGGGQVTIDGSITAPTFIRVCVYEGNFFDGVISNVTTKTAAQHEPTSSKSGYLEYTDGTNYVWVAGTLPKPSHDVTLNPNGGTGSWGAGSRTISVEQGALVPSQTATRTGYTLAGWNDGTTRWNFANHAMPARNVTLVAQWTANSYNVSYNANGGTGSLGSQAATYGESYKIRANTFKRTGYTFSGWNTAANGSGRAYAASASFTYNFTANTTLYAQWKPNTNTAYKVEHYKVSSTGKVTLAATQNLKGTTAAKVTAQARSFTGFTQGTKHRLRVATGTISANGTLTLKLYYKVNSYTITYAPNGATGTSVKQTVYYGESFKVRAASTFKRPGYTFSSWNTQAKGGGTTF